MDYDLLTKWRDLSKTMSISDFEKQTLLNFSSTLRMERQRFK